MVDLLQLRRRDEGGGFVVDEAPPGSQGGTGAAGTKP